MPESSTHLHGYNSTAVREMITANQRQVLDPANTRGSLMVDQKNPARNTSLDATKTCATTDSSEVTSRMQSTKRIHMGVRPRITPDVHLQMRVEVHVFFGSQRQQGANRARDCAASMQGKVARRPTHAYAHMQHTRIRTHTHTHARTHAKTNTEVMLKQQANRTRR